MVLESVKTGLSKIRKRIGEKPKVAFFIDGPNMIRKEFNLDLKDLRKRVEKYGRIVRKYLKAAASAETRARIARLIEWLTVGAGIPGCMHGGGSPEGAKLIVWKETDLDRFISLAKDLAGVEEETLPPKK